MADIVFITTAIAFFAICVLYVRWCDIILGPDDLSSIGTDDEPAAPGEIDERAA